MSHTVTIYGASDDLIEVDGKAPGCDEYNGEKATFILHGEKVGDLIPGRTLITVAYVSPGVWSCGVAPVDDGIPMVPCAIDLGERYDGTPGYSARARFEGVDRVEALDTADLLADAIFEGVNQRTLESLARQHRVAREALSGTLPRTNLTKEDR